MLINSGLKSIGRRMPRQKSQRPEVYSTGKREKLWKLEYRLYYTDIDGKEKSRHKSKTWSRANYTKAEAQAEADALIRGLRDGGVKADGSMTLAQFWADVYYPIRSRKWTGNTPVAVCNLWERHIKRRLGNLALKDITKAMIDIHLGKLVDSGLGFVMVDGARVRLFSVLEEALENDYIPKNPCRKVETPPCKPSRETRSLTEDEVRKLWDGTDGRDYLFWRLMILTGARIGEILPLERTDITANGLSITKALVNGTVKLPKRNKTRVAILPDSLRVELTEWLGGHSNRLIFPSLRGKIYRRSSDEIEGIQDRGRAAGIPDLDFRMCRTTFATLFEGDEADRSSIMGHHSTKFTLEKYRKPIQDRRQRSVEELDQRLKKVVVMGKKRVS